MLDSVVTKYRKWRQYNETIRQLSRLSNRELDDLGITRGEIPFAANGDFRRMR